MNEEEMRRVFKAKRKRQKKRRKERKKEEARQARAADRQRRVQQEAERIVQNRVEKGELKVVRTEESVSRAAAEKPGEISRKRANETKREEGPSSKVARRQVLQHALKEISPDQLTVKNVHLGSGSFGSCYLAQYRGMDVVAKELRVKQYHGETMEQAEAQVKEELIYEARIMNKLGDHPGLPLLFGVSVERAPYRIILQFHGSLDGSSLTISSALAKKQIANKVTWTGIICKTAEALSRIHEKGFLHNDLKSNNVLLDNRIGFYNPVVIDFGKSVPMSGARGPKVLSLEKQRKYARDFPHIAPEIVGGVKGQSVASDIFSLAKIAETIFKKAELGRLPALLGQALNADPTKRPSLDEVKAILA